ncbi:uncharacterized protein BCR38DRAFT_414051 [Pseudomassariella vexata]|uniref:Uncharacterized protein n=1 Tax=Pseudomassariella vexata TaxID=1141098 RepID=A0A1Y2DD52_9PEZI|nr:uncharacterized protein BCR38DRAFT_414051 [Pseudomassariella vexata]ORY57201.1 hypothetical protein BCR38DRAFT_414051 [Pseudomassariella vexata]
MSSDTGYSDVRTAPSAKMNLGFTQPLDITIFLAVATLFADKQARIEALAAKKWKMSTMLAKKQLRCCVLSTQQREQSCLDGSGLPPISTNLAEFRGAWFGKDYPLARMKTKHHRYGSAPTRQKRPAIGGWRCIATRICVSCVVPWPGLNFSLGMSNIRKLI